jgi:peptidoglycan/xylan/chitin deacetylase (PgdA/CDA1 family)
MACLVASVLALPAHATRWPNGAKAAVALTYDDSLDSQLDNAAPALEKAKLRGTFFLSNVKRAQVPRWRALATKGHELANHALFHPCPRTSYSADPRYTSEAYSPAQMVREIEAQEVLLTAIDGRDRHGFASPCMVNSVSGQDYLEPLRAAGIVSYGRTLGGPVGDVAANISTLDPLHVAGRGFPDNVSAETLIAYAQEAERGGGMAVYVFHGVGGDYLQVSNPAHQALLAWLDAHRQDVWVAPLGEILAWAKDHPDSAAQP